MRWRLKVGSIFDLQMVKRKRSLPLNNDEQKVIDGSSAEMNREALVLSSGIGCGTRSRLQIHPNNNTLPQQPISNCSVTSTGKTIEVFESSSVKPITSDPSVKAAPRTSARVSKRINKEATVVSASQPIVAKKACKLTNEKPAEPSKGRRSWGCWTSQEKDAFFEALCEYGKDFENIQLFIKQRQKRKSSLPVVAMGKNVPVPAPSVIPKNKDQVRQFYYRAWNKISKYLDFGNDVKKKTKELYGLINYAEMRKKIGRGLNEKNRLSLNELILHGLTSVKWKGKKFRIKTPICRALKKLNNVEDSKEPHPSPLPKDVCVELRPASNAAFARVQGLAQNPNLRTKIEFNKRLSTLLTYLEKRWKPTRLKYREQVLNSLARSPEAPDDREPVLRLRVSAVSGSSVSALSVAPMESLAWSGDLSFKSFQARIGNSDSMKKSKGKKPASTGSTMTIPLPQTDGKSSGEEAKESLKEEGPVTHDEESTSQETQVKRSLSLLETLRQDTDSNAAQDITEPTCPTTTITSSTTVESDPPENCSIASCVVVPSKLDAYLTSESSRTSVMSEDTSNDCPEGQRSKKQRLTLGQLLGAMTPTTSITSAVPIEEDKESEDEHQEEHNDHLNDSPTRETVIPSNEDLEMIRSKGWTLKTCESLTFGELCLMLDLPGKIVLEYDWVAPDKPTMDESPATDNVVNKSESSPTESSPTESSPTESSPTEHSFVTEMSVETTEKKHPLPDWISHVLYSLLSVSAFYTNDAKGKQATNTSPVNRNTRATHSAVQNNNNINTSSNVTTTPPSSKAGRRPALRTQRQNSVPIPIMNNNNMVNGILDHAASQPQQQSQIDELDQHVFVVPIGAAPRCANKTNLTPSPESVKDQLDRLTPASRRQQRGVRHRKPLVVQRPLLPRRTTISGPGGGMTLVHLLPSSSTRTLVLPSASGTPTTVQIATGSCGPGPASLSFVPPSSANSGLGPSSVPVVVAGSPASPAAPALVSEPSNSLVRLAPPEATTITPLITAASLQGSIEGISGLRVIETTAANRPIGSPPSVQISIPDTVDSSHLPSLLKISLSHTHSGVSQSGPTSSILDFGENSSSLSGAFGLSNVGSPRSLVARLEPMVPARQLMVHTSTVTTSVSTVGTSTPLHSPNSRFKISSPGPDATWLNGEGGDFSLGSLLCNLDSPMKNVASSSSNAAHQGGGHASVDSGSSLEARLGVDVDTHLQCLINENSVDYVAKFADLAAQISSGESKCASGLR